MQKSQARICVGCRQLKPRAELIRLTVDYRSGEVILNFGNKRVFGRSAYLCRREVCLTKAQKGNRLRQALEGRRGRPPKRTKQDVNDRKQTDIRQPGEKRASGADLIKVRWPLEPQVIKVMTELCTEHGKTCQNTER